MEKKNWPLRIARNLVDATATDIELRRGHALDTLVSVYVQASEPENPNVIRFRKENRVYVLVSSWPAIVKRKLWNSMGILE